MSDHQNVSSISTLELHPNGDYLAVGYDNGSIAVLKIIQPSSLSNFNNRNNNRNRKNSVNSFNNRSNSNNNNTKRNGASHINKLIGTKRKNIDENDGVENRGSNGNNEDEDDNQFKMELDDSGGNENVTKKTINSSSGSDDSDNNHYSSFNGNIDNDEDDRDSDDDEDDEDDIIKINIDDNKSYRVLCYYQAHDTEVIQIKWCKNHSLALLFLSTSICSIKLWRLQLLQNQYIEKPNLLTSLKNSINSPLSNRSTPTTTTTTTTTTSTNTTSNINSSLNGSATFNNNNNNNIYSQYRIKFDLKRSFEHEEIFNINSISLNSDSNTFLSSDELRVYIWDLNQNQECYNIIDLKPTSMQLLNEIIRVTKFHPNHCNLLMYGTSRGSLKLCDMRESALIHSFSRCYEPLEFNQSAFADYLNSIFDMSFSLDGRYIVSRNLQSLSIWDMNMDNKPLAIYNLYNEKLLNQRLYEFYEKSSFVNKFQCNFINQNQVITGSYDNKCLIWNPFNSESSILESHLQQQNPKKITALRNRIDYYFEQQQLIPSPSRDQVMSFFNKIYYNSNFFNIQLSTLSKIYNINNHNNNILNNNNNNNISNISNNILNNSNIINNNNCKLTINDYSRIGSISTAYNDNTLSLAISSSDHLFLYK
ncbi:hypothetical protein RB653_003563 [Dictyostelium firmibasis]|uniref:Serine/threonine-protein phosphatase 2A 55 kDa regulatory subunit B n=1 Tax=Dictyostelium firmibasis TaxID=79012 RepID=A0AAN7U4Z3_9MYCE